VRVKNSICFFPPLVGGNEREGDLNLKINSRLLMHDSRLKIVGAGFKSAR
jgi:hypothetical protein